MYLCRLLISTISPARNLYVSSSNLYSLRTITYPSLFNQNNRTINAKQLNWRSTIQCESSPISKAFNHPAVLWIILWLWLLQGVTPRFSFSSRHWPETFTHLLFTFHVKQFGALPAPRTRPGGGIRSDSGSFLPVAFCSFLHSRPLSTNSARSDRHPIIVTAFVALHWKYILFYTVLYKLFRPDLRLK